MSELTNTLSLQLLPEHRLFAQTYVFTHGDRGKALHESGFVCPSKSVIKRSDALLSRHDIMCYIYCLLQDNPDLCSAMQSDPSTSDYVTRCLRQIGSTGVDICQTDPESSDSDDIVPPLAAKDTCPAVFASAPHIGDLSAVQAFWIDVMNDLYQPTPIRLKASELYARSLGAFDRSFNKKPSVPINFVTVSSK